MPVRGELNTASFEDIVQGVKPEAHTCCRLCHPGTERGVPMTHDDNGNRLRGVCGVILLGNPAPDAAPCQDCDKMWDRHEMNHWYKGGM